MKKFYLLLIMLFIIAIPTGCEVVGGSDEIIGITINSADNTRIISEGETLQLSAVAYPESANQAIAWSSSDESIASVNEKGLVTGVKAGNVKIIATSLENNEIKQEFALIVEEAGYEIIVPEKVTVSAKDNKTTCKVGEKIELVAEVTPTDASQSIIWKSSDSTVAMVNKGVVTPYKEGSVEITATARGFENVFAKITLTFEASDKPIVSGEWGQMPYSTHQQYVKSENNEKLKVKGVVTIVNEAKGKLNYFIHNGTEGYYIYGQETSLGNVEVGKVYEVGGYKKNYNGLNEIVNVEHFIPLAEEINYSVVELDTNNPNDTTYADTYHCSYIEGNGVFTGGTVSTKAFNFTAKVNGYDTTFRVDPAYMSSDEFSAISNKISNAVSNLEFEFTGIMSAYGYGGNAKPQIMIVNSENLKFAKASDETIAENAKSKLNIAVSIRYGVNEIDLPATIDGLEGVSISWSSNNECINVESGAVNHLDVDTTVELTASIKVGNVTVTKVFNVLVQALDTNTYEVFATLDCEDANLENNWGNSLTKPSYNMPEINNTVTLGGHSWMLKNTLISSTSSDKYEGNYGIRAQAGDSADSTARIQIEEDVECKAIEFDAAVYGSDPTGVQIRIEYSLDSGATWLVSEVLTIEEGALETYRVKLPETADRVAIVVVENSGRRVNVDNIKLMK